MASAGANFFHLRRFHSHDADHAAGGGIGGRLHRFTPSPHHSQSTLETHGSGKDQGCIFSEAQTGRGGAGLRGLGIIRTERLQGGQAGDKNRRLAYYRGIEPLDRTIRADLGQIIAEDFSRLIEEPSRRRESLAKLLSHPHGLGSLSGEKKSGF
jgi:hypothetical protein